MLGWGRHILTIARHIFDSSTVQTDQMGVICHCEVIVPFSQPQIQFLEYAHFNQLVQRIIDSRVRHIGHGLTHVAVYLLGSGVRVILQKRLNDGSALRGQAAPLSLELFAETLY